MAEWFTEIEKPEKTMQQKGEITPSECEQVFQGLRAKGRLKISPQDAEWLKRLANILWEKIR